MSLSKPMYKPSYDFPEELLSEIFKRLPVKSVLRCGAVQKSWYSLTQTPLFISQYCNHQKLTAHINPKYLLFHNLDTNFFTVRSDDAQCQEYCTFDYPLALPANSWHTQSNGLICLSTMFDRDYDYNPDIFIWNPLVQKFKNVPESPLSTFTPREIEWNALAFGFLPEVNDYVVVHIVKPSASSAPEWLDYAIPYSPEDDPYLKYPHTVVIGVYSLSTNSWKEICQDKVFVDYMSSDDSVFVNGTAFWVGYNSGELNQLIMYFDTKTDILRKIMLPPWIVLYERHLENPLILPFGQSIGYFVEIDQEAADDDDEYDSPHLDIWVFEDDKIGGFSWVKKMSVGLSENVWAEVLGIRNNGEPILAKLNNLISYDLDTHEPYDFVESCERLTPDTSYGGSKPPFVIHPFVETLVLLDID